MENTHEVQTALIHFIQSKPEGNALRDIAIRTLKDLNKKEERSYYGTEELKDARLKIEREIKKSFEFEPINKREINVYTRKNLRKLRTQANMGQEHFARVVKLSRDDCANYENGRCVVPIEVVVNVCSAFNIPLEKFLTQSI